MRNIISSGSESFEEPGRGKGLRIICRTEIGLLDCGSFVEIGEITRTEIGVLDAGRFESEDKEER